MPRPIAWTSSPRTGMRSVAGDSARRECDRSLARMHEAGANASMITVTEHRARQEAELSDQRRANGATLSSLDGVPVVWKDVFDVVGTVTTCGSASRRNRPPAQRDGALVRRAHQLGMLTVGKTNLSEFAFSGLGINSTFGTPINPLDPLWVPGGSSSGAATAVATGIAPLAVGTDTSGSVRVPAAFTGCVGFRSSPQRYGTNDFCPLSPTLDSIGIIGRSVDLIREFDRLLTTSADPGRAPTYPRVIVPAGEWIEACTPTVRGAFVGAVERLRAAGVSVSTVEMVSLREAQRLMDENATIVGSEAFLRYGHLLACRAAIEPATRRRLINNRGSERAVRPVRAAMVGLRKMFTAELGGSLLMCPTVRHEPPAIEPLLQSSELYDAFNASTLRTTMALSYLGTCGLSLPIGDQPVGLLLSAPAGGDSSVLEFGSLIADVVNSVQK